MRQADFDSMTFDELCNSFQFWTKSFENAEEPELEFYYEQQMKNYALQIADRVIEQRRLKGGGSSSNIEG